MPDGAVCELYDQGGGVQIRQLELLANRERHDTHASSQITEGSLDLKLSYAARDGETTGILQFLW